MNSFHRFGSVLALGTVLLLTGILEGRAGDGDLYWTWMKGPSAVNRPGVYGTQGVGTTSNYPGAREKSVTWTDGAGTLWLFGGEGLDGYGVFGWLNDLWTYNPPQGTWTWMKGTNGIDQYSVYGTQGVAAPGNTPGGRYAASAWTDPAGALWLFGGKCMVPGLSYARLNDLWKYDPASGNWAWIKGSNTAPAAAVYGTKGVANVANTPGGRDYGVTWVDSNGALWLFGGYGIDSLGNEGHLNDLWKFNPADQTWTWMHGTSVVNQAGVYGLQGIPDAANTPGSRASRAVWKDNVGAFWLFGGYRESNQYFNDVWKYDPTSGQWAWMKGGQTPNYVGSYGTQGIPAPDNNPGARAGSVAWADAEGAFWLFGGYGFGGMIFKGELNDLWKFDPASTNWAWMKGSSDVDPSGTYGTQGVPSAGNNPGGRDYTMAWLGRGGGLWLFGGFGYENSSDVLFSDLWCCGSVYSLTYAAGAHGSLTGATSQTVVRGACGAAVTAVPDAGYKFSQWSDGVTFNPRQDLFVTCDVTATALFVIKASRAILNGDYDGDGKSDLCVYNNGYWSIFLMKIAVLLDNAGVWGGPDWIPVRGDYNGDGKADLAIYRNGYWSILSLTNGVTLIANNVGPYGGPGWTPVPGDYDGDGKADLAAYKDGYWTIYSLANGYIINNAGVWGGAGWTPVPGDYNGDDTSDLAVYNNGYWSIISIANPVTVILNNAGVWGGPGWITVPGDYDGDGKSDLCVYNNGYWSIFLMKIQILLNNAGVWGGPGWIPVSGDYDADGKSDLAVYKNGYWSIYSIQNGVILNNAGVWGGTDWTPVK